VEIILSPLLKKYPHLETRKSMLKFTGVEMVEVFSVYLVRIL
jgi:hypothetical protein